MDPSLFESDVDKYVTNYWSVASKAVGQILHNNPCSRVSFEQMYSLVYKCVCDGYAERLHSDLLSQCSQHLQTVNLSLNSFEPISHQKSEDDQIQLIIPFHHALETYLNAVQQITPVFAYLNKFYVEGTLQTSLKTQLLHLFRHNVSDNRMGTIMTNVEELLQKPFALSPAVMSAMFANLHCVGEGGYGARYPKLFSRYVPGILPPMKETDIQSHIEETQELQNRLRSELRDMEGAAGGVSRKRRGDDDNYGPLVCLPHE